MPVWIKVESALRRHRKVIRLGRMMGLTDERVLVGGLVLLWLAARESAPDGDISGWNSREVAAAAGFDEQDADPLYLALHECGFLDGDNGKVHLHDWMEHNGQFTRDAERMRNVRARSRTAPNSLKCSPLARAPGSGAGAGAVQEIESTPLAAAPAATVPELFEPPPPDGKCTPAEWAEVHAEFYGSYPRKVKRPDSHRAWKKIKPQDDATFNAIMDGLDSWASHWALKVDRDKIPYPATWLNARQWEDRP